MVSAWKRYASYAVGTIGVVITMFALSKGTGLSHQPEGILIVGSGTVAAAAYGWLQHVKDADEYDERSMHIRYRSGYVAFWTVYMFLFVFTMGGIRTSEDDMVYYEMPVDAYVLVLSAFVLGTAVMVVSRTWYKRKF